MNIHEVKQLISDRYEGAIEKKAYGETTYFYNPELKLKNGVYVCTIKEQDGPNDRASQLNREGIYRISTGLSKQEYEKLFGTVPKRPKKGEVVELPFRFDVLNVIMPHPVYSWMSWVCVNSPDEECFERFLECIDISYDLAKVKYKKRKIM